MARRAVLAAIAAAAAILLAVSGCTVSPEPLPTAPASASAITEPQSTEPQTTSEPAPGRRSDPSSRHPGTSRTSSANG